MLDSDHNSATNTDKISTLKAAIEIRNWMDLTETRRRDLLSALSRCVTFVGLPADELFLDPKALRTSLLTRSPAALGITIGSWRTLKSCLSYIMGRLKMIDTDRTAENFVWTHFLSDLPIQKRAALSKFSRYCIGSGLAPKDVCDETLAAFRTWLEARTLAANPTKRAGQVRAEWNRHSKATRDPSITTLSRLDRETQYTLPVDAFPTSFQGDLQAFGRRLTATAIDDFDDVVTAEGSANLGLSAPTRPCRPATVTTRLAHCRWAGSALVAIGVPVGEIQSLKSLITPLERVKEILRFYHTRAKGRPSAAGGHVADILRIIAKYQVGLPEPDIRQIKKWGQIVSLSYNGMTKKNMTHVRQMQVPEREAKLLLLPRGLLKAAHKLKEQTPKAAASVAMRAAAIGLLTGAPIRLQNLINLRLDEHLQRDDPPHGTISRLWIREDETKNRRLLDLPISARVAALLDEWIRVFRPAVAQPGCMFLFPGAVSADRPITPQAMRDAIRETVKSRIGVALTPHQFRHLAAATFLRDHPGGYEQLRQILGHANIAATVKSYCGLETESAVLRFHEVLESRITMSRQGKGRSRTASKAPDNVRPLPFTKRRQG